MRRWRPLMMAALAAAFICEFASADLVGLRVFREEPGGPGPAPPGPERWIYRVYAEFTEPSDIVGGWGVGGGFGEGRIFNVHADGLPGSGFTNLPNDLVGNLAPYAPGTISDWDTYMTIGVLYGQEGPNGADVTFLIPGTPTFITNGTSSWGVGVPSDSGVVLLPPDGNLSQGRGDFRVTGNDTATRVLLMQLVVNAGEHVAGTIGLGWHPGANVTTGLTFTSVPNPPTIGVFILPLLNFRRRREVTASNRENC